MEHFNPEKVDTLSIRLLIASGCPWRPVKWDNVRVVSVYEDYETNTMMLTPGKQMMFHPDGNSGCVHLADEYAFGIRCDHLMWLSGECEPEEMDIAQGGRAVMLIGNHKGLTMIRLAYEENK